MISKAFLVEALIRTYPRAWRREYGDELRGILASLPLTPTLVVNVATSGVWQRLRAVQPSTTLGLASLAAVAGGVVLAPGEFGRNWTTVVRPTHMTFPTMEVTFMSSEPYYWLLMAVGAWTYVRYRGALKQSAYAGARISLFAGAPVMAIGLLLAVNAVTVEPMRSGGTPSFGSPIALAMILAPIVRLPEAALLAYLGGRVARWFVCRRQKTATAA